VVEKPREGAVEERRRSAQGSLPLGSSSRNSPAQPPRLVHPSNLYPQLKHTLSNSVHHQQRSLTPHLRRRLICPSLERCAPPCLRATGRELTTPSVVVVVRHELVVVDLFM
jgi:hypothetical protein